MSDGDDNRALDRIEAHEKVCTERYGNIWTTLERVESTMNDRFNTISNRMFASAVGLAVMALAAAGTLVVLLIGLLQRGLHP